MIITIVPLSDEDIKVLKQDRSLTNSVLLCLIFGFLVLVYFIYLAVHIKNQSLENVNELVFGAFMCGLVIIGIVSNQITTNNTLKKGKKELLSGILTQKNTISVVLHPTSYSFYIDDYEIVIEGTNNLMENIEIGQKIILHRTTKPYNILKIEVLDNIN